VAQGAKAFMGASEGRRNKIILFAKRFEIIKDGFQRPTMFIIVIVIRRTIIGCETECTERRGILDHTLDGALNHWLVQRLKCSSIDPQLIRLIGDLSLIRVSCHRHVEERQVADTLVVLSIDVAWVMCHVPPIHPNTRQHKTGLCNRTLTKAEFIEQAIGSVARRMFAGAK
jgi:hypothetical protein